MEIVDSQDESSAAVEVKHAHGLSVADDDIDRFRIWGGRALTKKERLEIMKAGTVETRYQKRVPGCAESKRIAQRQKETLEESGKRPTWRRQFVRGKLCEKGEVAEKGRECCIQVSQ